MGSSKPVLSKSFDACEISNEILLNFCKNMLSGPDHKSASSFTDLHIEA